MIDLKFRVWLKEIKTMQYSDKLYSFFKDYEGTNIKMMQYTGLKDKNGVEIYEGDIIIHSDNPYKYYTAKFDLIFGLRFIDSGEYYVMPISPTNRPQTNIIVVGNIHENPTLQESHT